MYDKYLDSTPTGTCTVCEYQQTPTHIHVHVYIHVFQSHI